MAVRRRFIGGSDISAILGIEPPGPNRRTAYSVWAEKVGEPIARDHSTLEFLAHRKSFEKPILRLLRTQFDCPIVETNRRYTDPQRRYFRAEIDFVWREPASEQLQNGEIKTVSPFAYGHRHGWGEPGTSDIPIHYAAQAMWGLGITRRTRCVLVALVGLDQLHCYEVRRDEELVRALQEEADRFWHEYVLPRRAPPPSSEKEISHWFSRLRSRAVDLDSERADWVRRIAKLRQQIQELEREQTRLQADLARWVGEAWASGTPDGSAVLRFEGEVIATWNEVERSTIDWRALQSDHPELVERYRKHTPYRVLRIRKEADNGESV